MISAISFAKASTAATGGPNRLSRSGRGAGVEVGVGFAIEGRVGRLSSAMVLLAFRAGRPGEAWGEQAPGPQPGRSLGSDPSARDRGGHQYRRRCPGSLPKPRSPAVDSDAVAARCGACSPVIELRKSIGTRTSGISKSCRCPRVGFAVPVVPGPRAASGLAQAGPAVGLPAGADRPLISLDLREGPG